MLPPRFSALPIAVLASWIAAGDAAHADSCRPALHPYIDEVLYDAVGDDTGHEFVELFNPFATPQSLAGLRLEAGDGSGAGRWSLRWTGGAGDTLRAGGRFVIGGAAIGIVPNALATLDLQNGPDAVRLVWPDGAIEVVGYGALEFGEYFCGAPAPDVAAGESLARLPDDADLGSNALDFRAAPPTPGQPNQKHRDLAWAAGASRAAPALADPGAAIDCSGRLENRGADPIAAGQCGWKIHPAGDTTTIAGGTLAGVLAPGDTLRVRAVITGLAPGKRRLVLHASLPGDEAPDNDTDSLWVRVGKGPLQLTEIQFHPAAQEGEWVEVVNAGPDPLDLSRYGFADRAEHPGHATAAPWLDPDSLAILAQDRAALIARYPRLDTTRVLRLAPWPSLNNSNDASGIADVANLVELDGTPSDRFAYSASGIAAGVTLERDRNGVWGPSLQSGGTPLEPPAPRAAVPGRFEIEPRRLLGAAEARLRWDLPWPRARVSAALYDLAGRPRGQVLPETAVSGRGEQRWTPHDLDPGLYLLVLEARSEPGDQRLAVTRPIRLEAP